MTPAVERAGYCGHVRPEQSRSAAGDRLPPVRGTFCVDRQNCLANSAVYRHTDAWNSQVDPKDSSVNQIHNHAHDSAQLLVRRLERDIRWAKDRRRQHERGDRGCPAPACDQADRASGQDPSVRGHRVARDRCRILGGAESGRSRQVDDHRPVGRLSPRARCVRRRAGLAARVRSRRAAARKVLASHAARLSHTQYYITESVHSYIDARVEVRNTRELHLV